jgi:hypothetical protein
MTGGVKASRSVTRPRCETCQRKFVAHRADARHCSGRCRQRANRARQGSLDIDRAIEAARLHYWELVRRKAEALGASLSQVLTGEAQFVDADGRVFLHGTQVGEVTPSRPGWAAWGLEAAPAPFSPPPLTGRRTRHAPDRPGKVWQGPKHAASGS